MAGPSGRFADRLHLALALLCAWLIFTSPWIGMIRQLPRDAGFMNYAHVAAGLAVLALGVVYGAACLRGGGWRLYFPWLAGAAGRVAADLGGILRGRLPAAEGGGLFGAIEGLTLAALMVVAVTGAGWLWFAGTPAAADWRTVHQLSAHCLTALVILHALSVSLHVLDFLRD